MGLFDEIGSILSGGADDAAEEGGQIQAGAAREQGQIAEGFQSQALGEISDAERQSIAALDQSTKQALAERAKAGEALSDAEQRALAILESSGDEAVNAITGGLATVDRFASTGVDANQEIAALNGLLGPEAQAAARERFQTSPAFQFRRDQGVEALEGSAAARGGVLSGNTLKGITEFGQDLASEEFDASFNRLNVLANRGLQAGGTQANAGQAVSNVLANRGTDQAGVVTGTGNALANLSAGSGDVLLNTGANKANVITGSARDRVNALLQGTGLRTSAVAGEGNAKAAGIVGAANARSQGINNLLQVGGTIAGAAAGNPALFGGNALARR